MADVDDQVKESTDEQNEEEKEEQINESTEEQDEENRDKEDEVVVLDEMTQYIFSLDTSKSGNAMSGRQLKRMELAYGDTLIRFAINPSDYTQKEPNRATITQTKGGAWIDAWGAGIVEFIIKGITGVSGNTRTSVDVGYQRWKQLRDMFRSVYAAVQDGQEVTELVKLYNYTDNEFWYCYPTQSGIELYRNKSKPHVYQYTINLWGIRRIGEPVTTVGVIGNPNKEVASTEADDIDKLIEESTKEQDNENNFIQKLEEVKQEIVSNLEDEYDEDSKLFNTDPEATNTYTEYQSNNGYIDIMINKNKYSNYDIMLELKYTQILINII